MKDVLVIIPTYNEIENIDNIIISTFDLYTDINILIVDDNSPDFTFKKVQELDKHCSWGPLTTPQTHPK